MAMYGEHMEVQPAMGLKGGSDDGGVKIISGSEEGAGRGRVCMCREDEALMRHIGCTGVHEADS